jgi:hypothetical protein
MHKYQPINGWTKAEIINAITQGNQGTRSMRQLDPRRSHVCSYRGVGGNKCAVGIFIPDDLYHEDCERRQAWQLLRDYPGLKEFMPLPVDALDWMQDVHDYSYESDPRPALIDWVMDYVKDDENA